MDGHLFLMGRRVITADVLLTGIAENRVNHEARTAQAAD